MLAIKAAERSIFGKKLKASREAGQLPVALYGPKEPAASFFVPTAEFKKLLTEAGESTVVALETPAGDKQALIHAVDWHPVTGEPLHADFYVVDQSKTIKRNVPLHFTGLAPAVKDLAGILVKVLHELTVEALPLDLPGSIEVDISSLVALDSQILVKDLKAPAKVKVINPAEEVVAAISVAKEEPVEEAPVDLSAIEVEKKGKKEVEGEEGATAEAAPKADTKDAKPDSKKA